MDTITILETHANYIRALIQGRATFKIDSRGMMELQGQLSGIVDAIHLLKNKEYPPYWELAFGHKDDEGNWHYQPLRD